MKIERFAPEWIEEMQRLGIKPSDEFFFLCDVLHDAGMSVTQAVAAASAATLKLGFEVHETGIRVRAEIEAVHDDALAKTNALFTGNVGSPGLIPRIEIATKQLASAEHGLRSASQTVTASADAVAAATRKLGSIRRRAFWGWVGITSLAGCLIIAAVVWLQTWRLERWIAAQNKDAIAQMFRDQPMPQQLAYATLGDPFENQAKELAEKTRELEEQLSHFAALKNIEYYRLSDGTLAIRVDGQSLGTFPLDGYAGTYMRAQE